MVLTGLEVFLALYMSKKKFRSILGPEIWDLGPQKHPMVIKWFLSA